MSKDIESTMKILILGSTGMLGYSLFANLSDNSSYDVYGTVRNIKNYQNDFENYNGKIISNIDVTNTDILTKTLVDLSPDIVINCIGLIKQYEEAKSYTSAITINSLLPHQIASICSENNIKFIHFSTDCVFDGSKGNYTEADLPTAIDVYGASKRLGEVEYKPHLTLRTSIIGHGLNPNPSLIDWFLSEEKQVKGFSKAIFSGLPTCYIAEILAEKILKNDDLTGLYHLSVDPINKFELLQLVNTVYSKEISIKEDHSFAIDRSLNSDLLRKEIGLTVPSWKSLIVKMKNDFQKRYKRAI